MRISDLEYECLKQAITLIKKRKLEIGTISKCKSIFVTMYNMKHKTNKKLTPYFYNQLEAAVAGPLALLFFSSHSARDKNCIEELATFIEINTVNICGLT